MENAVQGLAEAQADLGHEVTVVTSGIGAKGSPLQENLNQVHVKRINSLRIHYPDLTIPRGMSDALFKQADFIHVHAHNSYFSFKILQKVAKLKLKSACYFMAVSAFQDHPSFLIRYAGPFYGRRHTRKAIEMANLLLVKSKRDLAVLNEEFGAKAEYLPDAVSENILSASQCDSAEFRYRFGIKQDKIFLFLGRMHKLKGPQVLVNALKYLDESVAAVFIGPDGGYVKETLRLADQLGVRDRTYILGYVDKTVKLQALDSSVALVHTSIADYVEVYPMVISEAWAREKPVIASHVGGVPYRVKDQVNGLLFEPSNPKMLSEAMLELGNNPLLARKLGKQGHKDVFSWKQVATKSVKLYNKILDEDY